MDSNHYHGRAVTEYEDRRSANPVWQAEQAFVDAHVQCGPVLDVPMGTGRYIDIYRLKKLAFTGLDISPDMLALVRSCYPEASLALGTVLALPFPDRSFKTAVCSRLLNWLYPRDMPQAVAELRRVAETIVVSIRTGPEGFRVLNGKQVGNYTHSLTAFRSSIDGLFTAAQARLSDSERGATDMLVLRPPRVQDALDQFKWHGDGDAGFFRISEAVAAAQGVHTDLHPKSVTAEYWSDVRIGENLARMARLSYPHKEESALITSDPPRFTDFPITAIRFAGHEAMIDGRRRANLWSKRRGLYPVLVVEMSPGM